MKGGGGGVILRFAQKREKGRCGLVLRTPSAARRKAPSLPSSVLAHSERWHLLSRRPMDALRTLSKILDSDSTSLAVNAREAPSPSRFDRPPNGTKAPSLLVAQLRRQSSAGEGSPFRAAAGKAGKAASLTTATTAMKAGMAASPLMCPSASPQHRRRGMFLQRCAYEGSEGGFRPSPAEATKAVKAASDPARLRR